MQRTLPEGKKKIALLGGAFDPPHHGHVITVTRLLNAGLTDEVWLVPSGNRPDKQYATLAIHRQAMVRLLIDNLFKSDARVKIDFRQLEEKLPGSYTIDLLHSLKVEYPGFEFWLVIGSELVTDLPHWKDSARLQQEGRFIVQQRPGSAPISTLSSHMHELPSDDGLAISVSSSALRALLAQGKCIAGLLPSEIVRYIEKNKLYVAAA